MQVTSLARYLVIILAMSTPSLFAEDGLLESYTWQNRLLLLFAPSADDPRLQKQAEILALVAPDLRERDMLVLQLLPDSPVIIDNLPLAGSAANSIYSELSIEREHFAVLLIGKDGGVKLSSGETVTPGSLFDLIDSMPMRQWEMQN